NQAGSVMLRDYCLDLRGKLMLVRNILPVANVGRDHERGQRRVESVVNILPVLVFDEAMRPAHFADIMIIAGDAAEELVCSHLLRTGLRQIAHHHAVRVGSGSGEAELPEQWMLRAGEL